MTEMNRHFDENAHDPNAISASRHKYSITLGMSWLTQRCREPRNWAIPASWASDAAAVTSRLELAGDTRGDKEPSCRPDDIPEALPVRITRRERHPRQAGKAEVD